MKQILAVCLFASATLLASQANATVFVVHAFENSSCGDCFGAPTRGLGSVILNAGDPFSIFADTNDLWSSGALPRFSDADGQRDRFATAADDSGQPPGTLIGSDAFPPWTQAGLTARYGSLVGRIGTGSYHLLGASFAGPAWDAGILSLYFWDSNYADNFGTIAVDVTCDCALAPPDSGAPGGGGGGGGGGVPEPTTWALMTAGLALAGVALRRRRVYARA